MHDCLRSKSFKCHATLLPVSELRWIRIQLQQSILCIHAFRISTIEAQTRFHTPAAKNIKKNHNISKS